MSGRKNKNKQRGHQRGQPKELLDELNSLRDLLGSDDLGDIPLLDQVAAPSPDKTPSPAAASVAPSADRIEPRPAAQPPLDEIDLPILFSPVDEGLAEDYRAELNESDRKLLRPLQNLRPALQKEAPPAANSANPGEPEAAERKSQKEQQQGLFDQPTAAPVVENPFLPAHIRARLTGGRVPKTEDLQPEPESPIEEPSTQGEALEAGSASVADETPAADLESAEGPESAVEADSGEETDTDTSERALLRQQLIDRLVAKQLPELERQLRARIEEMVDELETF